MGPMIADAPGTCLPICNTIRDNWGNCVDDGCEHWYDGCNHCFVKDGKIGGCTMMYCLQKGEAKCLVENDGH